MRPTRDDALGEVVLGTLAVAALIGVGTLGYVLIEGWPVMDALYMAGITITTIGFGEVYPLSPAGQVFTLALAFVGIGTFAFIASRVVQILVTTDALRQRAMQRTIEKLSGHYVLVGYGRIGRRIARDFTVAGRPFVVVERDEDVVAELAAEGHLYVLGDAEEEATLQAAGIARAAGLVLVLPQDAANVFVALTAREMMGGAPLFIVARTNEQTSQRKLLRAGADKVVSPVEIGADRIAQTILRPRVDRFMEQALGIDSLDFDLEEVTVRAGSSLDGRSLAEAEFRRRFQAIVVGVLHAASGDWEFSPDPHAALAAGDVLIVLAAPDQIAEIRAGSAAA